ncbi:MAG TPA: DUF2182 domain-containing protein [Rhodocyclaceae bacterium]|nr:DUF2182 domain-containing protein [Rhodocyclaceae bacterium]
MTVDAVRTPARERMTIGAALVLITLLSWAYMLRMALGAPDHGHGHMELIAMPAPSGWDWHLLGLSATMWCVMMTAMMLPSAAPMVLSFARVHARRRLQGGAVVPTGIFVAGYLAAWGAFGIVAAVAQMVLHEAALLSSSMGSLAAQSGGILLIAAGLVQFSPLKTACLEKCRTPLSFLLAEWREGRMGAVVMGLRHGAFCVGCCWALMLLMFVGGVMNLLWMAALTMLVLLEKVVPNGHTFGRVSGAVLIVGGMWVLGARLM